MVKKSALGRGLGALINDIDDVQARPEKDLSNEIEISKIEANPYQPRTKFDEEALNELAQSIKELGIVQPITVRKIHNNSYQLIAGERRYRAAKIAGLTKIPAYVRLAEDDKMLELALVENIQREDLDSIEIAISYQRLIEECKLTQESLSDRVGKKRSTVSNYLRLLRLPAEIQKGIREKKLLMGHARALVNVDDPRTQLEIFQVTVENDFSVRKVEELVRNFNQATEEKPAPEKATALPKEYESLKDHLANHFSAKVDLKRTKNGKGKIIIPFTSDDDLERILAVLDQMKS
ncbi:ParB/RepB/Spo0J family partition protein [Labilibaculum sp. A4]|uniref:ParB/RepB/Spo0J family partition protein n=1 Tax=Labilibaculum euxinus TaxID=2686357 RepID=A0A425YD33_9BACT|nr:ParB/RepB/Spo0J family partition protein [Labilibaculum euxinus]MDQ1769865.1 ParB/RepB/Spo0J family partition protein [Labilibaculum euxinus]MUP37850.1 ParB/RepB/Spo0J family partition protein [Labilibaculum euxinus]MVB07055.1 ParB/RepB/Spo0J family partition protein [Labilibaculum euxinus]MWN76421.1 ParB/RepB/Spo0J family partition protein [Labilibaculum euxinus]